MSNSTFDFDLKFKERQLAEYVKDLIIERTKSGKDIDNREFKNLQKPYNGSTRSTLNRTGKMLNSIIVKIKNQEVELESGVQYGDYHNTGTSKMDKREWLGLDNKSTDDVVNKMVDDLLK